MDYLESIHTAFLAALGTVVGLFLVILVSLGITSGPDLPVHSNQPSDVKLLAEKGHGSAVHIGNGYFLTAAHVVLTPSKFFNVKTHDGAVRKAEVLWASKEADIALVWASGDGIDTANLSCKIAKMGESVTLKGNPMSLEFLTSTGHIAGESRKLPLWKNVMLVDSTILPGQSGGPVFNAQGELIGITVGVATYGQSFMTGPTGYGMFVPGDTICELLGRKSNVTEW